MSYVLAPRSSDVSSQFRRLQSDRRGRRGLKRGQKRGGGGEGEGGYAKEPISTSIFAKHYRYDDAARVQQPAHVRAPGVCRGASASLRPPSGTPFSCCWLGTQQRESRIPALSNHELRLAIRSIKSAFRSVRVAFPRTYRGVALVILDGRAGIHPARCSRVSRTFQIDVRRCSMVVWS